MPELESIKNETWSILSSVALGTTSSKAAAGNDQRLTSGATRSVWLDCNRLDTYTANGSPDRPFKTLSETTSYWISAATGASMYMVYGTYSAGTGVSLPAYPLTIDGNGSTITYTGTFTINSTFVRRNLITTGGTTLVASGTTIFYGGSVGALTVSGKCYLYGATITGNLTIQSGGVVYKDFSTVVSGNTINNGTLYAQTTISGSFTASRAVVTDATGALASSTTTSTEIGYLSGVTSAIQTQFSNKQPLDANLTAIAALTGEGYAHRSTEGSWTLAAGSSEISWGSITGTLSSQTDLQTALNAKANTADLGDSALLDIGTTTGTVCAGDDSRLSDARTPTAHASTHGSAGSDPITITISQVTNLSSELSAKLDSTTAASTYLTIATASTTYQPLDGDLTAIAGLSGTAGILTKTAADTWSLDTNTYLTTTAAASTYQPLDADLTALSQLTGVGYAHRLEDGTWSLESGSSSVSWGAIGGTLTNQTDLVEALNSKANTADLGTALSAKAPVDNPTFTTGITTPAANITGLTASRALVSDASKNVTASAVTSTELGYVHGVTSAIQTQIDSKSPAITPINAQTGTTYTLVAADAGKIVTCTNASAITVTVPASTFSAGQSVIIGQGGAGQVTLAAGSGMTLHTTTTLKAKAQYARIAIMFDSASEGTVIGERAAS